MQETKPPLTISILTDIDSIPKNEWENLFGNKVVENYGYHKTIREANLKEFSIFYLVAKRANAIIAIFPFFTMDFSLTTLIRGLLQKPILALQRVFKRFFKMRLLFVGCPVAEHLYFGIAENEDAEMLYGEVLKNIYKFQKENKINTLAFSHLLTEHRELKTYLEKENFAAMESLPNSCMDIKAASTQDYINGLGASTRKDVRRKLRKSESIAKLETEITEDISGYIDEIYKLYISSFNDSDLHFEILTPEFFLNICRNMPGVAKYFITRENGKIVAFNLCFIKNGVCIDKVIGFDYACARKYHLYYTTFFHNIDWCIKNGIHFYQPGQGDYDAKIRLGAKLIPLHLYIKSFNPILNLFMKPIIRLISPKQFDPVLRNLQKYKKVSLPEVSTQEGN